MKRKVSTFLETYLHYGPNISDKMLNSEDAAGFLLLWPLYERNVFRAFVGENKDKNKFKTRIYAGKFAPYYSELDVEDIFLFFYDRYRNASNQVASNMNLDFVKNVLGRELYVLDEEDKLHLLFHVVYRYRNNIFHGQKVIEDWPAYEREMNYCLQFMMAILECAKHHEELQLPERD